MNNFTKDELHLIHDYLRGSPGAYVVFDKIQYMIKNYCEHDEKWIAKAHLKEARSLISHSMCLLGMDDE